jgi:hypothetical protein
MTFENGNGKKDEAIFRREAPASRDGQLMDGLGRPLDSEGKLIPERGPVTTNNNVKYEGGSGLFVNGEIVDADKESALFDTVLTTYKQRMLLVPEEEKEQVRIKQAEQRYVEMNRLVDNASEAIASGDVSRINEARINALIFAEMNNINEYIDVIESTKEPEVFMRYLMKKMDMYENGSNEQTQLRQKVREHMQKNPGFFQKSS